MGDLQPRDVTASADIGATARALRSSARFVEMRSLSSVTSQAGEIRRSSDTMLGRVAVGRVGRLHLSIIHYRVRLLERLRAILRSPLVSRFNRLAGQRELVLKTALDTNHLVVHLDAMAASLAEQQVTVDRLMRDLSVMSDRMDLIANSQSLLLRQANVTLDLFAEELAATRDNVANHGAETDRLVERQFAESMRLLQSVEVLAGSASRRLVIPVGDDLIVLAAMGLLVVDKADERAAASLAVYGDLERGTRLLIESQLSSGDTFVDVGANIGIHTLAGASCVGAAGRVVAIEPHPDTAQRLRRTVALNGFEDRVTVVQAAAAANSGTASLYLGPMSGHHSLLPGSDPAANEGPVVPTQTLDEIVGSVDGRILVKIDVEGWEHQVALGAEKLFARSGVSIIVEFGPSHLERANVRPSDWFKAFHRHGFEHRAIDALTGSLRPASRKELLAAESTNLFFTRKPARSGGRRAA